MYLNKGQIAIVLLLILAIAGCNSGSGQVDLNLNYRKGTKGADAEFLNNAPPEKMLDQTPFSLAIQLENKGASDIDDGIIVVSTEADYIFINQWMRAYGYVPIDDNRVQFDLQGRTETNPKGDRIIITARAETGELEKQTETHTTTILASVCYPYKSILSDTVCIDTDIYELRSIAKVCSVKSKTYSSQGGPIAVTRIDPLMLQAEAEERIIPQFRIRVNNVGKGSVFSSEKVIDACSSFPLREEDINVVKVSAALDGKTLKCEPEKLKLRGQEDTVRCSLTSELGKEYGNYLAPLVVELEYGYMETISKEIEIRSTI